jgi:hypothetical protein
MKKKPIYTTSAKEAYALELRKMQRFMSQLRDKLDEAIGDGFLPDNLDWTDVGSAKQVNQALADALMIQM